MVYPEVGKCYTYKGVYQGFCTGGFEDEDQGRPTGGWDGTFINAEGEEKRSVFNKNEISNVKEIDCGSYPKTILINRKLEVGKCYIYEKNNTQQYLGKHTEFIRSGSHYDETREAYFEDHLGVVRKFDDTKFSYIRQTPCQPSPTAVVASTPPPMTIAVRPVFSAMNFQDSSKDCIICQEPLLKSEDVVAYETTPIQAEGTLKDPVKCGHKFHRGCIEQWIKTPPVINTPCPVCREKFKRLRPAYSEEDPFLISNRSSGGAGSKNSAVRPSAGAGGGNSADGVTGGGNSATSRKKENVKNFIRALHSGAGPAFRPLAGAGGVTGGETIAVRTSGAPTMTTGATAATAAAATATAATAAAPAATAATVALTPAETEIAELRSRIDNLKRFIGALPSSDKRLRERLTKELTETLKSLDTKINELCALNPRPSTSSSICAPQGGRRYRKKTKMTKRKRQNRKKQRQSRRK